MNPAGWLALHVAESAVCFGVLVAVSFVFYCAATKRRSDVDLVRGRAIPNQLQLDDDESCGGLAWTP